MKIFKGKTDLYLHDTSIENLFINEYMVPAKGDYVKVYLFAKMYLEMDKAISNETLAKYLNLPLNQVLGAWEYWESKKVIRKHYVGKDPADFDVEFLCLKQLMYKGEEEKEDESAKEAKIKLNSIAFSDEVLKIVTNIEKITGRTLNSKECSDIQMWLDDWGMDSRVILKAYDICINERKKKPEHSYITAIIQEWYKKGLFNNDSLEDYLAEHDKKHHMYKRIFKALGFIGRYPTEEEKRIMDVWLDEYMLDISTILEACKKTSGIASPSINYINSILKDWKEGNQVSASGKKKPTAAQISKLYKNIRAENKKEAERRRKEIYTSFPRIQEIDQELKELNPKRLKLVLAGQKDSSVYKTMGKEMANLRKEKAGTLERAGYPSDYLNPIYNCPHCKDTGYLDNGEKCICLTQKLMDI